MYLQGGWEDDETMDDAARRETVEEAGVRGDLEVGAPPSTYPAPLLSCCVALSLCWRLFRDGM